MTFAEITRVMLGNMDFFQLRNVAEKYEIAFRGVRRQKLLKEVEKTIVARSIKPIEADILDDEPQGAMSAKPDLSLMGKKGKGKEKSALAINTFSARNSSL